MADQGASNDTNKQDHAETNKVSGEGPVNTSETAAGSGGAGELSTLDHDPDAQSDLAAGEDTGGPSLRAPTAGEPQNSRLANG